MPILFQRVRLFLSQHILAVLLVCAITLSFYAVPAHATSFSIDTGDLISAAADIFNGLWPVFAVVAGLALGIGLINFIVKALRSVV